MFDVNTSSGPTALAGVCAEVQANGFAFRTGSEMRRIVSGQALEDWSQFASSWKNLGLDLFMADGGRYRRRRFASLRVSAGTIVRKPHQPHYQSRDYNPLNGGVERWFKPVTNAVVDCAFTGRILELCRSVFDALAPKRASRNTWHVEMHQFRIEANSEQVGRPTPEGLHRDGVDWVCVMLVNRHNVLSGVTQIFDGKGTSLGQFTLSDPMDTVFLDDSRVLHGVTPIEPIDPQDKAVRDVLVITFRREISNRVDLPERSKPVNDVSS